MKDDLRIISLVPSITELLVDLGLEAQIVGITKFCVHPKNLLKEKTVVGGTKNIKIDKIEALNPTIILCNKEENTKEIVTKCSKITKTYVSDLFIIKDVLNLIDYYGKILFCEDKASEIISEIELKLNDFNQFIKNKPTLNVVYFIWKNPWMIAANNTFINHLLEINNFNNIYKNLSRYPEINIDDLKTRNIDCIFLSSEPFPFKEKNKNDFISNSKVYLVDGEYFSWYGTRLIKAFDYFKKLRNDIESFNALNN